MPLATRRPPAAPAKPPARPAASATAARTPPARPRGRAHVLDVPFELRGLPQAHGAPWDAAAKAFVFRGDRLPEALSPYRCARYSWERLKEDELNGIDPVPSVPEKQVKLRQHQMTAARAVLAARKAGRPGFLVADDVGLGKTMATWASVMAMRDAETVLVVCPLAVVAHWRRTIAWMGDMGKRIVVINYDRLKKLFDVDAAAAARMAARRKKKTRRVRTQKGVARYGDAYEFDVIVWDESHRMKNPDTARTALARRLSAEAEFELWLSATAGQNPLELSYLSALLAHRTGTRASAMKDYVEWCKDQGIGVTKGAYGKAAWRGQSKDEKERQGSDADLEKMREILFGGDIPAGIRRTPSDIVGWPEINRILLPVQLEAEDRALYEQAWSEFRRDLKLSRTGRKDSKNALVLRLRFRQKASLLRTGATVDLALELLEQGLQVAVSVAFTETLEIVKEALEKAGYGVATIHGQLGPAAKEAERLDFQHGRKAVCVYTVEEGISLHQGEYNEAKRANIVHDLRWSGIQMKQIEGRTHRDGKFSQVYWMVGADTVEEDIAGVVAGRIRSMSKMQGDEGTVDAIEDMLAGR